MLLTIYKKWEIFIKEYCNKYDLGMDLGFRFKSIWIDVLSLRYLFMTIAAKDGRLHSEQ